MNCDQRFKYGTQDNIKGTRNETVSWIKPQKAWQTSDSRNKHLNS